MKSLSFDIQKIWPMWKLLKSGRVKLQGHKSKILVPIQRSCHKKHTNEIWKPYHLQMYHSKDMATIKSFCRQTNRRTCQKLYALIFRNGGIKICKHWDRVKNCVPYIITWEPQQLFNCTDKRTSILNWMRRGTLGNQATSSSAMPDLTFIQKYRIKRRHN